MVTGDALLAPDKETYATMKNAWFETVAEAQRRARKRLPRPVCGALAAGSEKGLTVIDNVGHLANSDSLRTWPGCRRSATWPQR